jgi:hypothetical protein
MALTKEIVVDKIETLEMGQIQVRTVTRILEDGVKLSEAFSRHVLIPTDKSSGSWVDTDVSGEDARVQAIANATWTAEVIAAYRALTDG